jgi:hypothetical protein
LPWRKGGNRTMIANAIVAHIRTLRCALFIRVSSGCGDAAEVPAGMQL